MSDPADLQLNLLLFSCEEVHFGIDAAQVRAVSAYDGERSEDLFWFHEAMGYCDESVVYVSPVIVTISTDDGRPYRVIIDSMEEIAEFRRSDIHPFPALLEPFALRSGIWGILCRNGRMVILVDFNRLAGLSRSKANSLHYSRGEGDLS
jgi:chemotaxis signal transduction protein